MNLPPASTQGRRNSLLHMLALLPVLTIGLGVPAPEAKAGDKPDQCRNGSGAEGRKDCPAPATSGGMPAGIAPYIEYGKHVRASQTIGPLDEGMFGESVSLYNGSTSFAVTDIDVPGNNALPVRLSRQLKVELQPQAGIAYDTLLRGVGNWDIDVPHMSATFDAANGWPTQRCSGTTAPPYVINAFLRHEVWQGVSIHIPGEVERSLLQIQVSTPRPSTGGPYYWATTERDVLDCIAMASGLSGQGFRLTTTSGVRYYFDVAVTRVASTLEKWLPSSASLGLPEQYLLRRNRIHLLASKIEDRFGNTVSIAYNASGHPTSVTSNDGRQITMAYSNGRLASATSHGRTWQYEYAQAGTDHLTGVVLPDAGRWQYAYSGTLQPGIEPYGVPGLAYCQGYPLILNASYVLSATHPAGATGTFTFENYRHYRSGVNVHECTPDTIYPETTYSLLVPHYFDVMSIFSKSITGPGQPAGTNWSYAYSPSMEPLWGTYGQAFSYPCTTCTTEKSTTVTQPDGSKVRHRFGLLYMVNDGRSLGSEVMTSGGTVVRTDTSEYLGEAAAPMQAFHGMYGAVIDMADPGTARVRPLVMRSTVQDGRTFRWEVATGCGGTYCFDTYARPKTVVKTSSP